VSGMTIEEVLNRADEFFVDLVWAGARLADVRMAVNQLKAHLDHLGEWTEIKEIPDWDRMVSEGFMKRKVILSRYTDDDIGCAIEDAEKCPEGGCLGCKLAVICMRPPTAPPCEVECAQCPHALFLNQDVPGTYDWRLLQ